MDVGELPGRNEDVLWQLQMIAGEAVEGLCCNLLGQIRPHKPVQDEVVCCPPLRVGHSMDMVKYPFPQDSQEQMEQNRTVHESFWICRVLIPTC
jgi:hypothetical protein